jgi:hypothetical protein
MLKRANENEEAWNNMLKNYSIVDLNISYTSSGTLKRFSGSNPYSLNVSARSSSPSGAP